MNIEYITYITDCLFSIGGDIWLYGEERESRVHLRTNEIMSSQERLHQNTNYQQENKH